MKSRNDIKLAPFKLKYDLRSFITIRMPHEKRNTVLKWSLVLSICP